MIRLENVSYKVMVDGNEKTILNNISCEFNDGCVTAITGHNGSGKSTLTKIIIGIVKPTSGKVFLNDVDITNMTIDQRANLGINYAFQQPITFKGLTIKELIDIALKETTTVPKACEYLSKVGICAKEYINRDYDKTLSGGELKRIELALALAKKGSMLIFDEPEAGIDLWSFERLNNLFEKEKGYIVVSHQKRLLERADKILVLNGGNIQLYDSSKVVLKELDNTSCARIVGDNNG